MRIILTGPKFCLGESMQKNKGFTLIEMMVTIAVLAIVAMMAAPSFGKTLANQKLKQNIMELKFALQAARSQALLARAPTVVCLNSNNTNTVVIESSCVQKLTNHSTMSTAFKTSNVFLVTRDSKVTFDSSLKDDFFTFDNRGKAVPKTVKLCGGSNSYTLTLSTAGTIEMQKGDACS